MIATAIAYFIFSILAIIGVGGMLQSAMKNNPPQFLVSLAFLAAAWVVAYLGGI